MFRSYAQAWIGVWLLVLTAGAGSPQAIAQVLPGQFTRSETMLIARNDATTATVRRLQKSRQRWIEINLASQRLIAWEGRTSVYAIRISTGKAATPTQPGVFAIQSRDRHAHMKGPGYDVSDVPYTMYYSGNYAIHGAYWHRRFGTPVSHGCINLAVNHARWLFNWARVGTPVIIRR